MVAKTNTERVQALRKRRDEAGLSEVRGIWAPQALHAEIREAGAKLVAKKTSTLLGLNQFEFVPRQRVCNGIVIQPNRFSAPRHRLWWITDIGNHGADVRRALIVAAGVDPEGVRTWHPNVSFPTLTAAIAAITKATGGKA